MHCWIRTLGQQSTVPMSDCLPPFTLPHDSDSLHDEYMLDQHMCMPEPSLMRPVSRAVHECSDHVLSGGSGGRTAVHG